MLAVKDIGLISSTVDGIKKKMAFDRHTKRWSSSGYAAYHDVKLLTQIQTKIFLIPTCVS